MTQLNQVNSIASVRQILGRARLGFRSASEVLGPRITRIDAKTNLSDIFFSAFAFIRVIRGLLLRSDLAQNSAQFVEVHRFRKVEIEPGFLPALNVLRCAKAGERYRFEGSSSLGLRNYLVAAAVRQSDVAQDGIELFRVDDLQRLFRAIGHGDVMSKVTEKAGQRSQCVAVILDHQDTQTLP